MRHVGSYVAKRLSLFVFAWLLALTSSAHAYIDPASGSYLIQFLIATLLGGAVVMKTFWGRTRDFFRGLRKPR